MGILYIPIPITPDCRQWLAEEGIQLPHGLQDTRNPTPSELRLALEQIPNIRLEFGLQTVGKDWYVEVSSIPDAQAGPWTSLVMSPFEGEDVPTHFVLRKGWPELVIAIIAQVAVFTGPLVLVRDADATPVVIFPDSDPQGVLARWQ